MLPNSLIYKTLCDDISGFPNILVGKKKTHLQCRRLQFNSWVRKIHRRRDRLPTLVFLVFPCGSAVKESACNAGDLGSIPGSGRSPGSHVRLSATPWTVVHQTPLSIGFYRQYWSGLPFPSPGDLPNPWIKPTSLVSPALAA